MIDILKERIFMKKILLTLISAFLVFTTFSFASDTENKTLKVHPFTGALGSVSNILEFNDFLILIDPQETYKSTKALNSYIKTLDKPLKAVILATHPIADNSYNSLKIYGFEALDEFVQSGKISFFIDLFEQRAGENMIKSAITSTNLLKDGENEIEGIKVDVKTNKDCFPPEIDIDFKDYGVYFTHLAANDSHLLIHSKDEVKLLLKKWKKLRKYNLVLSSHLLPIDQNGVEFTISYLEKAKEILNVAKDKDEFVNLMKEAYPNASMEAFLYMSADSIFK